MTFRFSRLSLLWKISLSTSLALTAVFAVMGWIVLRDATRTTSQSIDDEVRASFQAYQSLWKSRADLLSKISLVMSAMSDVRAAFGTGDENTIRDTAGELWKRVSEQDALFLVSDPRGHVIASLGGTPEGPFPQDLAVVREAAARFPEQASGFMMRGAHLYHITITPLYVQSTGGPALLDVLLAGYDVDQQVAQHLKQATGGSEFLFASGGRVIASTLDPRSASRFAPLLDTARPGARIGAGSGEYALFTAALPDIAGQPIARLAILRSYASARQRIAMLRRNIILLWLCSIAAGLLLTYVLAQRIVRPLKALDIAAAEVSRQNFDLHVPVESEDEIGRLAVTFNTMCASIRRAREELIRQEQISTIGRLSSSIVHDLRNPLAAIYGGAEMLVDADLPPSQVRRLSANIYRASRRIQELLQDLLNVSRGKTEEREICDLRSVAAAAVESFAAQAETQSVSLLLEIPAGVELPLQRGRMERVFANLIGNGLEAMPDGGELHICAVEEAAAVVAEVRDTGCGIPPELADRLFQPFVTAGKKSGLGLGLVLARQAVLDLGGDMWVESHPGRGSSFRFRLPRNGALSQSA